MDYFLDFNGFSGLVIALPLVFELFADIYSFRLRMPLIKFATPIMTLPIAFNFYVAIENSEFIDGNPTGLNRDDYTENP